MKKLSVVIFLIFITSLKLVYADEYKTGFVNCYATDNNSLYVRTSPGSLEYTTLLSCNKALTILDENAGTTDNCDNWYKISYGLEKEGYVCSKYVYTDYVINDEDYSIEYTNKAYVDCHSENITLNLRNGINGNVITSLSCNQEMTVLEEDAGTNNLCSKWYKVSTGSKTGYVCSEYTYRESVINVSDEEVEKYEKYLTDMGFPSSYTPSLIELHKAHPKWKFRLLNTRLNWDTVIDNESVLGRNLVYYSYGEGYRSIDPVSYNFEMDKYNRHPTETNWWYASPEAIRYYMDPRNFLVDSPYLFQFLKIDYDETSDEDIYNSLNGTFLYSRENASLINNVCRENNANPYFIIARIIQEQGNGGGETYRMVDSDGTVYYNLFNIGASGNGDEVYNNALKKAKEMGWTSVEKSIRGGITFLISSYIGYKQNTIYLNKFDVESYQGLYWKQYMQNIEAPKTEAISMYNKMNKANLLNRNLTFIIPVYENMPQIASYSPDTIGELYPKNLRVKEGHSRIVIRAGASTSSLVVGYINDSSVNILSVERFSDGWHKIVLTDGTKGFIKFNSSYLEEVDDIVNVNEEMRIKEDTVLRVGPGIEQTEITFLPKGEIVNRIENLGIYNFGGEIWDRIRIADGRQGFVMRKYLEYVESEEQIIINSTEEDNVENDYTEFNTASENFVVHNLDTSDENVIVQNTITNEENFVVHNLVTEDNNIQENIIEENYDINEITETNEIEIENNVIEEENVEFYNITPSVQAKDLGGRVTKMGVETIEAGTGYILEIEKKQYIIVKSGDVNGDGYVKANDYLIIKDYIMGSQAVNLSNEFLKAADVTKDNKIKANDYLKIKDHIMLGTEI